MAELTISQTQFDDYAAPASCRQGRLVVMSGPDKEHSIIVQGPVISIGTLPDNSLALSDKTVSRHHAELVEHAGQYFIHDLGSTNGTIVNGQRIKQTRLEIGAIIKLGYTQLAYLPCEQKGAPAASGIGEQKRALVSPGPAVAWGGMSGCSPQARALFSLLDRVAATDATIIIEGETGTGKERLARAIHEKSSRAGRPFVVYDCRSIAAALLESELMGHEKGAFPGATRMRGGVFEQASGGTLFLDEICELDLDIQPKLLRVLENHEVRRLGGEDSISVDARIIASSGSDLEQRIAAGGFRKDLFYRLAVHRFVIPPLRERPEDIPLIAADLLKKLAPDYKLDTPPLLAAETVEILQAHAWPGNIRELRNVLSRAMSLGCTMMLRPENLLAQADEEYGIQADSAIEKIAIKQALMRRQNNMLESAQELGMPHKIFLDKAKKYGLC